jgi:hypothetical protein
VRLDGAAELALYPHYGLFSQIRAETIQRILSRSTVLLQFRDGPFLVLGADRPRVQKQWSCRISKPPSSRQVVDMKLTDIPSKLINNIPNFLKKKAAQPDFRITLENNGVNEAMKTLGGACQSIKLLRLRFRTAEPREGIINYRSSTIGAIEAAFKLVDTHPKLQTLERIEFDAQSCTFTQTPLTILSKDIQSFPKHPITLKAFAYDDFLSPGLLLDSKITNHVTSIHITRPSKETLERSPPFSSFSPMVNLEELYLRYECSQRHVIESIIRKIVDELPAGKFRCLTIFFLGGDEIYFENRVMGFAKEMRELFMKREMKNAEVRVVTENADEAV